MYRNNKKIIFQECDTSFKKDLDLIEITSQKTISIICILIFGVFTTMIGLIEEVPLTIKAVMGFLVFFASIKLIFSHSHLSLNLKTKTVVIKVKSLNKKFDYSGGTQDLRYFIKEKLNDKNGIVYFYAQIIFENEHYFVPFQINNFGVEQKSSLLTEEILTPFINAGITVPIKRKKAI